ncbi:cation transporter [bacterium]|nr:cation transporter [bacterium]
MIVSQHRAELEANRRRIGYWEGNISIVLNIILFGLKYWVGLATSSVAIIADAWHTLSDSLTSLVVIIGFKISAKPADQEHPFGHGRAEIIGSVIIGTLLAIVGFNFLTESVHRFIHHHEASYSLMALIVFIISALSKEALAQFSFWGGRKFQSQSLLADGWHHRSDAIASALIVGGFFLGRYFWWVDSVMGFCVSILIFIATFSILKHSIDSLLGENIDNQLREKLHLVAVKTLKRDLQLHHLHLHSYGEHREVTCHIRLPSDLSLRDAHDLVDRLEQAIREELDLEATIHYEPERKQLDQPTPGPD